MGRWKMGPEGPSWDANDSGPDQVQGMPAGGPQGGAPQQPQAPGGFQPPTSGISGGMPGQQPQPAPGGMPPGGGFNPPNMWAPPEEKDTPGWGPIKISTHFQPGDGFPHPFENGFQIPKGGGNNGPQGGDLNGFWAKGGDPGMNPNGGNTGVAWGQDGRPPHLGPQFLPHGGGPLFGMLQQTPNGAGTPTPNDGESYGDMESRYFNDYHAPDRNDVITNMIRNNPNPTYETLLDGMGGQGGRGLGFGEGTMGAMGGGAAGSALGGALGGMFGAPGGGGGMGGISPLLQALMARRQG